jgi:hypothetical protein
VIKQSLIALVAASCLAASGCASFRSQDFVVRFSQGQKLSQAIDSLEKGNPYNATRLLREICAAKGVAGVTDEALFRLALLSIDAEPDRNNLSAPLKFLDRLQKEYPNSPWTAQATPLADFLEEHSDKLQRAQELRRQVRSYKDLNLSLARENKELRQSIERLKNLDLELERKK